jgi:hypothetical protein
LSFLLDGGPGRNDNSVNLAEHETSEYGGNVMRQRFVFRIRTKSGGIVGNIVIEAKDQYEAEHKLKQRYPDCEVLNCEIR